MDIIEFKQLLQKDQEKQSYPANYVIFAEKWLRNKLSDEELVYLLLQGNANESLSYLLKNKDFNLNAFRGDMSQPLLFALKRRVSFECID